MRDEEMSDAGASDDGPAVTRALVLAAGRGSRLDDDTPKPLYRLLGVPLLARTLFTLEKAGVTDAWVVLGYEAEGIRAGMAPFVARMDLRVHWLHNDEWEKANGVSVLAARDVLDGPFVLSMSDHVLEPGLVEDLVARAGEVDGLALAVDRDRSAIHDLDDATKVRVRDGGIDAIGKGLDDYDAIDTGVFLATPALFDALEEAGRSAGADGGPSLSDGVQRLADRGRARVADVTGRMWQDVDTPADVEAATEKLLARLRKDTDGPVSRHINRPVSLAMSRQLVKTPVTPNQISVAAMLLSFVAAGFAAVGGYGAFLAAALLFQFASIVDGSDGEVAKLTFQASVHGEWVDTICDNLSYLVFLGGAIVGVWRTGVPDLYLELGVVGLVAAGASLANIHFYLLREEESGSALSVEYAYQRGDGLGSRVMRVLHYLGKRDVLAFLVLVMAAIGQIPLALPAFGAGAALLLFPATLHANVSSWLEARSGSGASGSVGA